MTREVAARCPEEEGFVARYACGGCDDDERRWFAAHLASCEACAAKLRSVRMIVETLESWQPPPLDERRRRQYRDEFRRTVDAAYGRSWWDALVKGAAGLGALVDLSRVPRPAAAGLAAVVVAAGAVAASYYWRGGDGMQFGARGGGPAELVADGEGAAGRNPRPPDRTDLGRRAGSANSPGVVGRTRPVSDVVAKAAAILEARAGAGDGTDEELRRLRLEVKLRLLRSKLAFGSATARHPVDRPEEGR